ncbi:MAG: diadenylate cyclase, partial [Acidobacteriia bacterium]|nr:diadenylate cyclase [Terriglobia bacterium]
LYGEFFERGVRYFFPDASLVTVGRAPEVKPTLLFHSRTDGGVDLEWMGTRYHFACPGRPFTEDQLRLLGAVGAVLSVRYRSIFSAVSATSTFALFEGLPEDRYVSAFLDHTPYLSEDSLPCQPDVVANAIEVLRESSLLTYENRRISTGVILTGSGSDALHADPVLPEGALRYTNSLVGIKSFHRLCDGLQTVFLVDRDGMLVDLVDIQEFSRHHDAAPLPAPSSARYLAHSLATLDSGHICLVLTPNGEIKVFAGGVQVFNFMEGRWHLTDIVEKYREFQLALGDVALAERLFTAALNLAEHRRGGLFVVLRRPESARELVSPTDLLENDGPPGYSKGQIHYLLRRKDVLNLELSVLQSIARVDGGIVMDRGGRLLAFGAILRHAGEELAAEDGGRSTAAVHASRFGPVLKISEDGSVSFYGGGLKLWEI